MVGTPDTYSAPLDFRISQNSPDGLPPNLQGVFDELYTSTQQIIHALTDFCGIGQQPVNQWSLLNGSPSTILRHNLGRFYATASEIILFGAVVNIFNNAGVIGIRNANATNNAKPCDGFCSTVGGIAAGAIGEVIIGPGLASIAGIGLGTRYFLSTVNGLVTTVAPVAAGNIEQYLGVGLAAGSLYFTPHYWIQH